MKLRLIILTLFISCLSSPAQNKLLNGSFEDGDYDYTEYQNVNYVDNLENWESDYYFEGSESGHSPDWQYESHPNAPQTPSGEFMVGFWSSELIQQQLTTPRKFVTGQSYLITFSIYLYEDYDAANNNNYEDYDLNVYLSKNKIRYSYDMLKSSQCDEDYAEIDNSQIILIESFDLDNLSNQQWIELQCIYTEPEQTSIFNDFDWFGVEMINNDEFPCLGSYLYIDNFSIVETSLCTLEECKRTTGPSLATDPYHIGSTNSPIWVFNLDNFESAEDISILNGANTVRNLPDVYSLNGIYNQIFWDGKNDSGNSVQPGLYYWKMDLTNECGTVEYNQTFFVAEGITEPIPSFLGYNNTIATPLPCCLDQDDITIDYDLTGSGLIEFVAVGNVLLENMTIDSSVDELLIQAGGSIVIGSGVIIESGTKILFDIKQCTF